MTLKVNYMRNTLTTSVIFYIMNMTKVVIGVCILTKRGGYHLPKI